MKKLLLASMVMGFSLNVNAYGLDSSIRDISKVSEINLEDSFIHEYDSSENPNGYEWCGHAALQTVVNHYSPNKISISNLHKHFLQIDYNDEYSNGDFCTKSHWQYCASLVWMHSFTIKKTSWGGLGWNKSVIRYAYNKDELFQKIKDAVATWGRPVIIPAKYQYDHNWVIAGIADTGDKNTSYIKLYDVAQRKDSSSHVVWVPFTDFHDAGTTTSPRFDILIVKPNGFGCSIVYNSGYVRYPLFIIKK